MKKLILTYTPFKSEAEKLYHLLKQDAIYNNFLLSLIRSKSGGYRIILTINDESELAATNAKTCFV